ncbi:MAG: M48 family metalloprotease [Candidatus Zixiibacteriota bacterium]|nr:MAG: M48 family metalloprotease [candidate division Zixibacteria bacterium]
MNSLKVSLLMIGMMLLLMWVGYYVGGQSGLVVAFVIAAVLNFATYWFSDKVVLRIYRAREVTSADHPRLHGIVNRVAQQASLTVPPRVCVVPSRAPNAFATGRSPDHAAVAVTEGLLELLNDEELEGVIGHEIAHITNKDMLIGTIAATFAGAIGILASIARWGAIFGGLGRGDDNRGGGIGLLIAAIVAPLVALVLQMAISRQREYKADARSGQITGRYLPLARALEKLHRAPVKMRLDDRPATAHLMIANPLSGRGLSAIFSTHPPVEERIARLERLAQRVPYTNV